MPYLIDLKKINPRERQVTHTKWAIGNEIMQAYSEYTTTATKRGPQDAKH